VPCYQSTSLPGGVTTTGRTSYKTEAECNEACKEGACCEGTTCSVKPQCQCQGTGKVFKGVGTTCSPNPCLYGCGGCNSIPASLTATITSSGGNYLADMGCVAGDSTLSLVRPNTIQLPAPSGCWNSTPGNSVFCDASVRSNYWSSGTSSGSLMFRTIGQCIAGGEGARVMSQMYLICSGSQLAFGFSCGRNRTTSAGCPDAFDFIGNPVPFSTVFDQVQIGIAITSCSPFVATGTATVRGFTLTVAITGNPLP